MRRYLILAPDAFATASAKTAHGVIAYGQDACVGVVDASQAGKSVHEVTPYLQCEAPIVDSVAEGLALRPTALLIGVAPQGGALCAPWRGEILTALRAGLEVVSGMHELLRDDLEFMAAARQYGASIWDVRVPPTVPLFSGQAYAIAAPILLTVGSDCAVGKMTVSLEIVKAAQKREVRARFVPTGQTGIIVAGWGICVDRVIADFAPGAAEQLVLTAAAGSDLLVVEGQGAISHPAYGPVTLALLYGCAPDALVLVAKPTQTRIEHYSTPVLPYAQLVSTYEALCATVKPSRVVGIALNTQDLSHTQALREIDLARDETHLPVDDVVRFGPGAFYDAIRPSLTKRSALEVVA
ncbi:MAG: DUF1611 domain-containing protein [Candidatus Eremiobacteraeota bacterium]|nr:DUF1611 domain-containing protein [Candidatus Eremiobacteraeota bacterium]